MSTYSSRSSWTSTPFVISLKVNFYYRMNPPPRLLPPGPDSPSEPLRGELDSNSLTPTRKSHTRGPWFRCFSSVGTSKIISTQSVIASENPGLTASRTSSRHPGLRTRVQPTGSRRRVVLTLLTERNWTLGLSSRPCISCRGS